MALHTELPIYRTGVRLLDLAVKAQVQMPRTVKRVLGEKITQHCVEMLDLMALANATQRDVTGQIVKRPGFPAPSMNASQRLRAWPTAKVLAYFQGIGRTIEPARGNAEVTGA